MGNVSFLLNPLLTTKKELKRSSFQLLLFNFPYCFLTPNACYDVRLVAVWTD